MPATCIFAARNAKHGANAMAGKQVHAATNNTGNLRPIARFLNRAPEPAHWDSCSGRCLQYGC